MKDTQLTSKSCRMGSMSLKQPVVIQEKPPSCPLQGLFCLVHTLSARRDEGHCVLALGPLSKQSLLLRFVVTPGRVAEARVCMKTPQEPSTPMAASVSVTY